MRRTLAALAALALTAMPVLAQEGGNAPPPSLLTPNGGLMVWTLVIFLVFFFVLAKFAFGPITRAVENRERALEKAIEDAKRDREDAAKLLAEQRAQLDASRGDAQKLIADARATGEKLRNDMLEQTRAQQAELLERAKKEIENERERAIADLRKEAVDLALMGASKVIEKNLDDATNRKLVESFLQSVSVKTGAVARG